MQRAQRLDLGLRNPQLFLGLAQRRVERLLAREQLAARAGDLAGVVRELARATGQQHLQAVVTPHQRHEHGRRAQRGAGASTRELAQAPRQPLPGLYFPHQKGSPPDSTYLRSHWPKLSATFLTASPSNHQ